MWIALELRELYLKRRSTTSSRKSRSSRAFLSPSGAAARRLGRSLRPCSSSRKPGGPGSQVDVEVRLQRVCLNRYPSRLGSRRAYLEHDANVVVDSSRTSTSTAAARDITSAILRPHRLGQRVGIEVITMSVAPRFFCSSLYSPRTRSCPGILVICAADLVVEHCPPSEVRAVDCFISWTCRVAVVGEPISAL